MQPWVQEWRPLLLVLAGAAIAIVLVICVATLVAW